MQFVLERRELLTLPGGPGQTMRCLRGCLWITRAGEIVDFVLHAGESLPLHGPGDVVVQALAPAALECLLASAHGAQRHQRWSGKLVPAV